MTSNVKLLKECPILNEREKDLLLRIDVKGEKLSDVASSLDLSKSTVSTQRKRGKLKLEKWLNDRQAKTNRNSEDFDKQVFKRLNQGMPPNKVVEELGHAVQVFKLWEKHQKIMQNDYCAALNILFKWIKKEECSEYPVEEYPLAARVEKLRMDEFGLSLEHGCTWDLLTKAGLTYDLEDEDFSVYEAIKRLVEEIGKPQRN